MPRQWNLLELVPPTQPALGLSAPCQLLSRALPALEVGSVGSRALLSSPGLLSLYDFFVLAKEHELIRNPVESHRCISLSQQVDGNLFAPFG